MPTSFSGKREDLQNFLQEVKIYLLAISGVYISELDKVLFVLSCMTEGDASSGRKNFMTLLSIRQLRMAHLSHWELSRI